ncbi:RNA exonuclease 4 [Panicum miliaceum]|uniref:RNA exonuclease 4 n=1 Tax=Panicum miliaceum TaxID=4540 RepID=A0A3L6RJF0_PANMI|nr:RNA exonuclease 4 [Panicum miliaceum]
MAAEAAPPPPSPSATGANPSRNPKRKRKPKPKAAGPSALNPNWAQLQSKLPQRPAATHLGKRKHDAGPPPPPHESAEPAPPAEAEVKLEPTSDDASLTKAVAIDCEMVGVGSDGSKSALGRVTLVNSFGNVVYDEYVRTVERIVDYRTRISGIRPKHMNKAKEFWVVQKEVAELIKGRILVGHALHNDLKVLLLSHPKKDVRDTSEYEIFRRERKRRSLRDLAAEVLGAKIQQNEHCPIEDARAAMFIYNKHKKAWEKSMKEQFRFKKKLKKRGKKKPAESNVNDPNVPTVLL